MKDMQTITARSITEMSAQEIEIYLKQRKGEEQQQAGYRKKEYTANKDNFLKELTASYLKFQAELTALKSDAILQAENFNFLKYDLEGKPVKEAKSFELKNDAFKVVVEIQERFDFTDEAIVHINAIKDIFRQKFETRNKGFYNLLDGILMKNGKGDYDVKLLTRARRQVRELGDDALIGEFDKLTDCQIISGSVKYIRVYIRANNKWKDVSLNFSSLEPAKPMVSSVSQ